MPISHEDMCYLQACLGPQVWDMPEPELLDLWREMQAVSDANPDGSFVDYDKHGNIINPGIAPGLVYERRPPSRRRT